MCAHVLKQIEYVFIHLAAYYIDYCSINIIIQKCHKIKVTQLQLGERVTIIQQILHLAFGISSNNILGCV